MRFDAILFDCDGVLVDSELITNNVLREMLGAMGWQMTQEQCMAHFVGHLVQDQGELIFKKTGQQIDDAWIEGFRNRRNAALSASLTAIPHINEALIAITSCYGQKIACASGADRGKVVLQLTKTNLLHFFEGRIFSGVEMPKSKPAPDVYLAAAAALGVDTKRCARELVWRQGVLCLPIVQLLAATRARRPCEMSAQAMFLPAWRICLH
jgi:beta-phosphoglucomutase-like phosphatase (HAD superfamily)